jgi:hypothetical protein
MIKLLISLAILSNIALAQYEGGSHDKGLTYYKYLFKDELGYLGSKFTGKYTTKEWKKLFANDAKGFKEVFMGKSKKLDSLLESEKFERIAPHIKAFAIYYSKDSGYSPHCGNNDIDVK